MAIKFTNDDFVLGLPDIESTTRAQVDRFEPFLEALSVHPYEFQREAVRLALHYLLSSTYPSTQLLALKNYSRSVKLRQRYQDESTYLEAFSLADKKAISLDLATGAGKSFVLYGIARIALAIGVVDKVLVLCPSLTIEEGLKDKFNDLAGRQDLKQIVESLGAIYPNPQVKSANDPILDGDICVENIHAVYERTGSSIVDSFKAKGSRTLVLNDEAHHIFSGVDANTKKWLDFLRNPEFGFNLIVSVSGTPYIEDNYFPDVIFRYGLKQAIEERVAKTPDYVVDRLQSGGTTYQQVWENHDAIRRKYAGTTKPMSIIVTERILRCVQVWGELVAEVEVRESISREEAERRVIWVASGVPSGAEGVAVKQLINDAEKVRKENLRLLKSVGSMDNPVEWIVSVSMLTEGWDVPNVFQVVPWESKAFNSKLLIAQVLGRGLRVPPNLPHPMYLTVENHEAWTESLKQLFLEVLEVESRVASAPVRAQFAFPLFNLEYKSEQVTVQTSKVVPKEPDAVTYSPQALSITQATTYSQTGVRNSTVFIPDNMNIANAAKRVRMFIEEKDTKIAKKWTIRKIDTFIKENLRKAGQDDSFISRENFLKTQQAFGPMFRPSAASTPRQKLKPDALVTLNVMNMPMQSVSEDQLRTSAQVFFSEESGTHFGHPEEKALWAEWLDNHEIAVRRPLEEIKHFAHGLQVVAAADFKCPTNLLIARFQPEQKFVSGIIANAQIFDAFLKNSDMGFYAFPYSFKPTGSGSSHARTESFNPDFLLNRAGTKDVLVVEIKHEGDDSSRNKAKQRDANLHFIALNDALTKKHEPWRYYFYFLSEQDYATFFSAVRDGKHREWKSSLMMALDKSDN